MSEFLEAAKKVFAADLIPFFQSYWPLAERFFNSGFFSAIAGSLAGAFAGATAAQRIADKTRHSDDLLKELRCTNAATMVAFDIANSLLSAKKQHIKAVKVEFDKQRSLATAAVAEQLDGHGGEFDFRPDFRTLPILNLPIGILQTQIFEKLSLHGRPFALLTTLAQSLDGLNTAITRRNHLIACYKASSYPPNHLMALYFGFRFNHQLDSEYGDLIEGIYQQTDDSIFFSTKLCADLSEHASQLSASFKARFGNDAPQVVTPDFSKAKDTDLMPDEGNYTDWVGMFVKREDKPKASMMQFIRKRLLRRADTAAQ